MTQAQHICAGLNDPLSAGDGGADAALAQEELHAALREVQRPPFTSMALAGLGRPCPCSAQHVRHPGREQHVNRSDLLAARRRLKAPSGG